jgi:hypothetical protein
MRFRVGILDICAALIVAAAILLPARAARVDTAYDLPYTDPAEGAASLPEIAAYQARLSADPADGEAAEGLARLLEKLGQHDQALRSAAEGSRHESPARWRALLAMSSAPATRIEIPEAHEFARRALEACRAPGARCGPHEQVRLQIYLDELDAGLLAMQSGIDPRREPDEFRRKMLELHPTATFRSTRPR